MEQHLDFEKRIMVVHKPNRVDPYIDSTFEGTRITNNWKITYTKDATNVVYNAVKDLQDYFHVSMGLELAIEIAQTRADKTIFIAVDEGLEDLSFNIKVDNGIVINGCDSRYTAQGCYALEDALNLNQAPVIKPGEINRKMRFSFRAIDSGLHDRSYPDAYLSMIAHAGMTAIDISIGNNLINLDGAEKINDLIKRAAVYGLDVYAFPLFKNTVHPDEEGAFEHYNKMYGRVLELCPGLKGFIIVGECCEFPSKDPRTTGKAWTESLLEDKSSPGWFPCNDYPQFISLLRDVIRLHSKDTEVVFWTYNWGYEDQKLREELISTMPTDITMMATFEMFEEVDITPQVKEIATDYTLWQIGPSKYYTSEAKVARDRDVRMYSMTNTCGNTWDIGGVPYLPAPQRWIQRWQAVTDTQDKYKLDGTRESHSYGFWPSFLPEMAKYAYMSPPIDMYELLDRIIVRDFGKDHLEAVRKAYSLFSQGMAHCVSTNEDQYGPARIGPSFPLVFKEWELIPPCTATGLDVNYEGFPVYTYNLDNTEKLLYETQEYYTMAGLFDAGCTILANVVSKLDAWKKDDALQILQVAQYIANNALTIYHVKRWHYLKGQLGIYVDADPTWVGGRKNMEDAKKAVKPLIPVANKEPVLMEMLSIAKAEIQNAWNTIPLVEANSRLGFENEYGYSCDKEHLLWKIRCAEKMILEELLPMLKP